MIEGQLVVIQIHEEAHFVSLFPNMMVVLTTHDRDVKKKVLQIW